ncbi:MAG: LCP family protein [Candidatus Falkowbacteria bacterium]|nr:LCP family protein [Candidatus Falkowbacteria bacterium]
MIDFKQKMEEEQRQNQPGFNQELEDLLIATKKRRKTTTYIIALIVIGIIFAGKIIMSSQGASGWFGENSWFSKIKHLTGIADNKLKGEENDRVNILLLGMGGKNHDGAYLTDTIILASIKPSTGQVALISIPRDLTVPIEGSGWRKINNINALAEAKQPGNGGEVTRAAISDLFDVPIAYYVSADFDGFTEVINELGGIDVNVENTLEDYEYPILGQEDNPNYYSRFEHLYIPAGPQKMTGELALKYARSRHAYGKEGTDFARSHRQQLIMEAVKEKLLSRDNLLKPVMIAKIINQLETHVSTNLEIWEMVRLWDLTKTVDRSKIINKVVDNSPDSFLIDSRGEDGAYILVPKSGNFNNIKEFIRNIFGDTGSFGSDGITELGLNHTTSTNDSAKVNKATDYPRLEIMNGTWINGLAGQEAGLLKEYNFNITKVGNAADRNYTKTLIYDLTYGKKATDLKILQSLTGAELAFDSPEWLKVYTDEIKAKSTTTEAVAKIIAATTSPTTNNTPNDISSTTKSNAVGDNSLAKATTTPKLIPDFVLLLGADAKKY